MSKRAPLWRRCLGVLLLLVLLTSMDVWPMAATDGEEHDILVTTDFSSYDTIKVACIGASTTEGTKGYSYPAFLQTMLGGRFEVRNFGHGGTSVISGRELSYFNSVKYAASLAYKADIVIIDIGGNDTQPGIWNGGNNTFAQDYEELILSYLRQDNHPLVLLSLGNHMHQFDPSQTFWGSDESINVQYIIPILRGLAEKYGLPTVPLLESFIGHEEEYIDAEDGVHYTAAGYKAQAQLYYDKLTAVATFPADSGHVLWKPTTITFGNSDGEFDGYKVIQWINGTKGKIQYDSGSLAAALGIENGTVVNNLTIAVSYYWDQKGSLNDCIHFNTNDKDGLSAPGIANGKEHDNGYGSFLQYGMKANCWDTLIVSRDEQMLGAPGAGDWTLNIGALDERNSLYINGYAVYATRDDGRVQVVHWGESRTADRAALNTAIAAANDALAEKSVYTADSVEALRSALADSVAVNRDLNAVQDVLDVAADALNTALVKLALYGDVDGVGKVNAADALLTLKAATGQATLTTDQQTAADVDHSGEVDIIDALIILQYAAGKISAFPAA